MNSIFSFAAATTSFARSELVSRRWRVRTTLVVAFDCVPRVLQFGVTCESTTWATAKYFEKL